MHTLGKTSLLNLHKLAFLCSRKCPAARRLSNPTFECPYDEK